MPFSRKSDGERRAKASARDVRAGPSPAGLATARQPSRPAAAACRRPSHPRWPTWQQVGGGGPAARPEIEQGSDQQRQCQHDHPHPPPWSPGPATACAPEPDRPLRPGPRAAPARRLRDDERVGLTAFAGALIASPQCDRGNGRREGKGVRRRAPDAATQRHQPLGRHGAHAARPCGGAVEHRFEGNQPQPEGPGATNTVPPAQPIDGQLGRPPRPRRGVFRRPIDGCGDFQSEAGSIAASTLSKSARRRGLIVFRRRTRAGSAARLRATVRSEAEMRSTRARTSRSTCENASAFDRPRRILSRT